MTIMWLMILITLIAFLAEDKIMSILLTMEMIVLLTFYYILWHNSLCLGLETSLLFLLMMMISESVLMICLFINLLRFYKSELISSLMVSKL